MKSVFIVPLVLPMALMAGFADANEITDGLAESACTLDVRQNIPLQQPHHGTLKLSGCQVPGSESASLPFISMSVRGPMIDELGIIENGQYQNVSGANFIMSDIVNSDMEFKLGLHGSKVLYPDNTALFELSYM
jgi:hypothetical protein